MQIMGGLSQVCFSVHGTRPLANSASMKARNVSRLSNLERVLGAESRSGSVVACMAKVSTESERRGWSKKRIGCDIPPRKTQNKYVFYTEGNPYIGTYYSQ